MSTNRTRRSPSRLVLLAALAALLLASMPIATEVQADPRTRCGTRHSYYSDPGMTELIGQQTWLPESCGCGLSQWGSSFGYRVIEEIYTCY